MQLTNQQAEQLVRDGVEALRRNRPAEARQRFEAVTQTGRATGQIWLLLATACRAQHDGPSEEAALDQLLAIEPRAARGHIMKGDCRLRAGDETAALHYYKSALMITDGQQLPADLLAEARRAEAAIAQIEDRFDAVREATLAARGLPAEARSARFQHSLDIMAGRKRIYHQQPTSYYFPELPQVQFFETADFDWVAEVEAAADDIRAELTAVLAAGADGFRPYIRSEANAPRVDDNHLLDNADWSALFLCENGQRADDVIERCPLTWKAVQAAPLPDMPNSPTAMFSLLRPRTRIAPHTGVHNARLICHLPLIVPPGCGFRVGNEVREWQPGKLLIFDDSIEHEAWNDSAENRVVLIFDIWRPELSERERAEVRALFAGPMRD